MFRFSMGLVVSGVVTASLASCTNADTSATPMLRHKAPSASSKDGTEPRLDASTAPSPAAPTTDAGPIEIPLADIDLQIVSNGWGPIERNTSNGDIAPNDGRPLTLGGIVYPKGLGVHATSDINVLLDGRFRMFVADVGVDDEVGDNGSVVFQVSVDGVTVFDSGTMTGSSESQRVGIDITGKRQLRLVVTDAGDGNAFDHADWAGARLLE
jgi:hypothetical protein